jgi:hypothetical protein
MIGGTFSFVYIMSWLVHTRKELNNTVNRYNKNLKPLGLRVVKHGTNGFEVKYQNGNKLSYIGVNTRPNRLTANLARGITHPNNRGKGIAMALRTYAIALLRNAGYRTITHNGVNFEKRNNASLNKTGKLPITTYILRKYLGFTPKKYFKSELVLTNNTTKKLNEKLNKAKQLSRLKLEALRK